MSVVHFTSSFMTFVDTSHVTKAEISSTTSAAAIYPWDSCPSDSVQSPIHNPVVLPVSGEKKIWSLKIVPPPTSVGSSSGYNGSICVPFMVEFIERYPLFLYQNRLTAQLRYRCGSVRQTAKKHGWRVLFRQGVRNSVHVVPWLTEIRRVNHLEAWMSAAHIKAMLLD